MNIKRFHERNMHLALQKIREELGNSAVLISSNQNSNGVEVVAATDYESVANGDYASNLDVYKNNVGMDSLNVEKIKNTRTQCLNRQVLLCEPLI